MPSASAYSHQTSASRATFGATSSALAKCAAASAKRSSAMSSRASGTKARPSRGLAREMGVELPPEGGRIRSGGQVGSLHRRPATRRSLRDCRRRSRGRSRQAAAAARSPPTRRGRCRDPRGAPPTPRRRAARRCSSARRGIVVGRCERAGGPLVIEVGELPAIDVGVQRAHATHRARAALARDETRQHERQRDGDHRGDREPERRRVGFAHGRRGQRRELSAVAEKKGGTAAPPLIDVRRATSRVPPQASWAPGAGAAVFMNSPRRFAIASSRSLMPSCE